MSESTQETKTKELLEVILANTFTVSDFNHRLSLLKGFLEYQFFKPHENLNLFYLLNEFINSNKELRDEFNALSGWGQSFYDSFNKINFYQLVSSLEKEVSSSPTVTLYLPFVPRLYEVPKLASWFRQNVHPQTMIDIKLDRRLIGGTAIVWKGNYYDFSLRYYLAKSKESILKVIAGYTK